ncbi:MAG: hypothetical protein U0610_08785 [bacterium]
MSTLRAVVTARMRSLTSGSCEIDMCLRPRVMVSRPDGMSRLTALSIFSMARLAPRDLKEQHGERREHRDRGAGGDQDGALDGNAEQELGACLASRSSCSSTRRKDRDRHRSSARRRGLVTRRAA